MACVSFMGDCTEFLIAYTQNNARLLRAYHVHNVRVKRLYAKARAKALAFSVVKSKTLIKFQ